MKLFGLSALALTLGTCLCAISAEAALTGHFEFEETSGSVLADSSGNGFDATAVNPGGTGDLNVSGVIGSAYRPGTVFTDHGIRSTGTTDFGISGNNARTIAFWFNTSSFGGATDQYRLMGIGNGAPAELFDIVAEASNDAGNQNRIGLRYGNGNVYFDADNSGTAFAVDTWYHIAVVYDGTTLDLESVGTAADGTGLLVYVNGVQVDTAAGNLSNSTQALTTAADEFVTFGIRTNLKADNGKYPGLLDDVRIYDEAISASAVAALVPEPSSLALLGLGGLCMLRRRRRYS